MSDNLDEDDIDRFLNLPVTSEPDRGDINDGGWGIDNSDSDDINDDDGSSDDSDFAPTQMSLSESEFSGDDTGVNEYEMDVTEVTNVSTGNNDSTNEQTESENISLNDILNDNVNDNLNDDLNVNLNENQEQNVEDNNAAYVTLAERFKNLKKKTEKAQMKKEEEGKWQLPENNQQVIVFDGSSQFHFNLPRTAEPIDFFSVYLNDDILDIMVYETNRNAAQVLQKTRLSRSSRLRKWRPTNTEEIKKFLGLIMYMGLVPMPRLSDYWSKRMLYRNLVAKRVMSRNRFQLLLRFWHFNNNENLDQDGRLAKISPLVSHLNQCFSAKKTPGEDLVVDESMIPFRGRLIFRQYLPNKTHKYGIKIFKVCDTTGYTLKVKVYMGKGTGTDDGSTLATSVVMDLMRDYLDQGHTLYIDNFYTSLDLGHILLARKTHLVGTVIWNRAWFPHKKTIPPNQTIEQGEMNCLEYPNGTIYTRWVDKREVRMMSTKHPIGYSDTGKKTRQGKPILKPIVVVEYNKAKMGIDLSDQMSSYSTSVRKSMRWYHKVGEEMLLGTAVVNAWLAYKEALGAMGENAKKNKYSITSFRESIVYSLLGLRDEDIEPVQVTGHHYLSEPDAPTGEGRNKRRPRKCCKVCYQRIANAEGRNAARKKAKKVTTMCNMCPQKPYLCKECFKNLHK